MAARTTLPKHTTFLFVCPGLAEAPAFRGPFSTGGAQLRTQEFETLEFLWLETEGLKNFLERPPGMLGAWWRSGSVFSYGLLALQAWL